MSSAAAPDDRAYKRWSNVLSLWRRPKPVVGATPADVVYRENKMELLRYRARPEGVAYRTPVVMVPSMINRHYVLDLRPGASFVEYLVSQGHDVYMITWGTPSAEDRYLSFDEVCDGYLGRAIRHAAKRSERGKAHVLGYCMGGSMAAIHASVRKDHIASLATLAAPVRFRDESMLSTWASLPSFDIDAMVDGLGNAPWQLLQGTFLMQRPTMNLAKLVGLVDRAWDDNWLDAFLALETWVNDNVSLPGEAFRRYISELYKREALVNGTFTLSGEPARIENIACPLLAVTFEHDVIVPWKSAAELVERAGSADKERLHLQGGHVGAVVSRKAAQGLWSTLSAWWAARDTEPAATLAAPAETLAAPAETLNAVPVAPAEPAVTSAEATVTTPAASSTSTVKQKQTQRAQPSQRRGRSR